MSLWLFSVWRSTAVASSIPLVLRSSPISPSRDPGSDEFVPLFHAEERGHIISPMQPCGLWAHRDQGQDYPFCGEAITHLQLVTSCTKHSYPCSWLLNMPVAALFLSICVVVSTHSSMMDGNGYRTKSVRDEATLCAEGMSFLCFSDIGYSIKNALSLVAVSYWTRSC